jgi:hypothetical protein
MRDARRATPRAATDTHQAKKNKEQIAFHKSRSVLSGQTDLIVEIGKILSPFSVQKQHDI